MIERPTQEEIDATPTFLVDANVGMASVFGIARVTFGTCKLNPSEGAELPKLVPTLTVAVPEKALLAFAHEVIERAERLGITLSEESS